MNMVERTSGESIAVTEGERAELIASLTTLADELRQNGHPIQAAYLEWHVKNKLPRVTDRAELFGVAESLDVNIRYLDRGVRDAKKRRQSEKDLLPVGEDPFIVAEKLLKRGRQAYHAGDNTLGLSRERMAKAGEVVVGVARRVREGVAAARKKKKEERVDPSVETGSMEIPGSNKGKLTAQYTWEPNKHGPGSKGVLTLEVRGPKGRKQTLSMSAGNKEDALKRAAAEMEKGADALFPPRVSKRPAAPSSVLDQKPSSVAEPAASVPSSTQQPASERKGAALPAQPPERGAQSPKPTSLPEPTDESLPSSKPAVAPEKGIPAAARSERPPVRAESGEAPPPRGPLRPIPGLGDRGRRLGQPEAKPGSAGSLPADQVPGTTPPADKPPTGSEKVFEAADLQKLRELIESGRLRNALFEETRGKTTEFDGRQLAAIDAVIAKIKQAIADNPAYATEILHDGKLPRGYKIKLVEPLPEEAMGEKKDGRLARAWQEVTDLPAKDEHTQRMRLIVSVLPRVMRRLLQGKDVIIDQTEPMEGPKPMVDEKEQERRQRELVEMHQQQTEPQGVPPKQSEVAVPSEKAPQDPELVAAISALNAKLDRQYEAFEAERAAQKQRDETQTEVLRRIEKLLEAANFKDAQARQLEMLQQIEQRVAGMSDVVQRGFTSIDKKFDALARGGQAGTGQNEYESPGSRDYDAQIRGMYGRAPWGYVLPRGDVNVVQQNNNIPLYHAPAESASSEKPSNLQEELKELLKQLLDQQQRPPANPPPLSERRETPPTSVPSFGSRRVDSLVPPQGPPPIPASPPGSRPASTEVPPAGSRPEVVEKRSVAELLGRKWKRQSAARRVATAIGLIGIGALGVTTGGLALGLLPGAAALGGAGLSAIAGAVGGLAKAEWQIRQGRKELKGGEQMIHMGRHRVKNAFYGALFGWAVDVTGADELIKQGLGNAGNWLSSWMPNLSPSEVAPPPPVATPEPCLAVAAEMNAKLAELGARIEGFETLIERLTERVGNLTEELGDLGEGADGVVEGGAETDVDTDAGVEVTPSNVAFTVGEDAGSVWEGLANELEEIPAFEGLGEQGALAMHRALTDTLEALNPTDAMQYLARVFPGADPNFLQYVIDHPPSFDRVGNMVDLGWTAHVPSGQEFDPAALTNNEVFEQNFRGLLRGPARALADAFSQLRQ